MFLQYASADRENRSIKEQETEENGNWKIKYSVDIEIRRILSRRSTKISRWNSIRLDHARLGKWISSTLSSVVVNKTTWKSVVAILKTFYVKNGITKLLSNLANMYTDQCNETIY